ncbi:MAG: oligosaccharide flippase family protein [Acidobacteria bacterium]|nr:oligosaccharide flippase family protein [Acidobacteriota bacterium]
MTPASPIRTLTRDAALNLAGQLTPFAIAFLAMPATIRALGPERFGILGLAWTILGSAGLVDLAAGRAVTKFASAALAQGDRRHAAVATKGAARSQLVAGVAATLALAAFTPLAVGRLLDVPESLAHDARIVFLMVAVALPAVLVTGCYRGLLEASGRFDLVNAQRVVWGSMTFALPWLGVSLGWSLPQIAATLVAARFVSALVHAALAYRQLPELGHVRASGFFGDVVVFGGHITIASLILSLHRMADQFLLGALSTLAAVGHYSIAAEMALRLSVIQTSIIGASFPSLVAARAARDGRAARAVVGRMATFVATLLGPPCALLVALAHPILGWWLDGETADAVATPLRLLVTGAFISSFAGIAIASLQAYGRPEVVTRLRMWLLAPLLLGQAWAIANFGIEGAAWGALARSAFETTLLTAAARIVATTPPDSATAA